MDTIVDKCNGFYNKADALLKDLIEKKNTPITYEAIIEAFNIGDDDVRNVLTECGQYLGIGIANIINIFNPKE